MILNYNEGEIREHYECKSFKKKRIKYKTKMKEERRTKETREEEEDELEEQ